MAYEDFIAFWEESDVAGLITVEKHKLTGTAMDKTAVSYVRRDFGAAHFSDFEHLLKTVTTSLDIGASGGFWALTTNVATTNYQEMTDNDDAIGLYHFQSDGAYLIRIKDFFDDELDDYNSGGLITAYLTIKRRGTAFSCKIYSDATRTTLVDTIAVTDQGTKFRYMFAMFGRGGAGAAALTETCENLDLQEPVNPLIGKPLISPNIIKKPIIRCK